MIQLNILELDKLEILREIKNNGDLGAGGELGELILYVFLEKYEALKADLREKQALQKQDNNRKTRKDSDFCYIFWRH